MKWQKYVILMLYFTMKNEAEGLWLKHWNN